MGCSKAERWGTNSQRRELGRCKNKDEGMDKADKGTWWNLERPHTRVVQDGTREVPSGTWELQKFQNDRTVTRTKEDETSVRSIGEEEHPEL